MSTRKCKKCGITISSHGSCQRCAVNKASINHMRSKEQALFFTYVVLPSLVFAMFLFMVNKLTSTDPTLSQPFSGARTLEKIKQENPDSQGIQLPKI